MRGGGGGGEVAAAHKEPPTPAAGRDMVACQDQPGHASRGCLTGLPATGAQRPWQARSACNQASALYWLRVCAEAGDEGCAAPALWHGAARAAGPTRAGRRQGVAIRYDLLHVWATPQGCSHLAQAGPTH
jgi:hypothetical protein